MYCLQINLLSFTNHGQSLDLKKGPEVNANAEDTAFSSITNSFL